MTYRYVGPGFLPGIPARDLSDEEAKRFGVERSPLYERERRRQAPEAETPPEGEE